MKKVVNIVEGICKIDSVPDDWVRCSVSGEYRPKEEYFNSDGFISRTNCERTYCMPLEEMQKLSRVTKEITQSPLFCDLSKSIEKEESLKNYSISVLEFIEKLNDLPKDSRLVVTQAGYYADGELAEIFFPQEYSEVDGVKYYEIGNSYQSY